MAVEHIIPNGAPEDRGGETAAKNGANQMATATIIDIRKDRAEESILDNIKNGLRPELGSEKTLPTLLLYDVAGLKLFEKITYLEEYYLTNTEIEVLEKYAVQIAERIEPNSIVVELGSG
jgi:L-histidine Nalpha-methyltransferase / hercynylcysteine S-oxide synthase